MAAAFPKVTTNILSANIPQDVGGRSILLVGQMVSGTAASGSLISDLKTEADFISAFGRTSQICRAGRDLIRQLEISSDRPKVSAIGLVDHGSGVAATGTVAFSGTASASGAITVYIDNTADGKYQIDIASGDTATAIGAKLVAAITANLDSPVTAINTTGSVALTAINKGTQGNFINLASEGSVAGITVAITAFASGATNPSLTTLFDPIQDLRFTSIVYPSDWGLQTLYDFTESRFNVDNKVIDGIGIATVVDTYANLNSLADTTNKKTLTVIGSNKIADTYYKGSALLANPLSISAQFAAIRELRLTVGSNISSIAANGIGTGGSYFGAIPYHNTPFFDLPVIKQGYDFSDVQAKELQDSGLTLLRNNPNNSIVICQSAVTTYKTNIIGQEDKTFKYLNYVDTLSIVREYFWTNTKAAYPQHMLTSGVLIAGLPMVNSESFVAKMITFYEELSGMNNSSKYGLLVASNEAKDAFKKSIERSIKISMIDGKIEAKAFVAIVTQVREILLNFIPTFE